MANPRREMVRRPGVDPIIDEGLGQILTRLVELRVQARGVEELGDDDDDEEDEDWEPPQEEDESSEDSDEDEDESDAEETNEDANQCPICKTNLRSEIILELPCGHRYHLHCLRQWASTGATNSNACPLCLRRPGTGVDDLVRPLFCGWGYQEGRYYHMYTGYSTTVIPRRNGEALSYWLGFERASMCAIGIGIGVGLLFRDPSTVSNWVFVPLQLLAAFLIYLLSHYGVAPHFIEEV